LEALVTTDPRARQHRRNARDAAMRRISTWTAALALASLAGSGAVAVVARAATQAGVDAGASNGAPSGRYSQPDQGDGSGDTSGGLLPPLDAPGPQMGQAAPLSSSGGS
jgi:hypothetical protein